MKSLLVISYWLFLALNLQNKSVAQESGSIIPLYVYPENGRNSWQTLFDAHRANPITTWAIVNVNSGPGPQIDPNYATSIPQLHSAGINTLGYVLTGYASRSSAEVRADIDRWKSFYSVHGIFFDEMSFEDNDAHVNYYRELNNYTKSQGFTFTVGNPGTGTIGKYFDTVDNIVIFETDTGFPSKERLCSQDTNGKGRGSVSIMPYNIGSLNETQVRDAKDCAGFIYVTDDILPNPWDTIPNYLTQLFALLKDENENPAESGSIIPLYSYPRTENGENAWQRLLDAQRSNPITTWAIVNVNSGPGSDIDSNYATSIPQLHSAGINTLGYVYTRYANRSEAHVIADINRWKSFYNVNGIYLDEMSNDDNDANVNYYREINNYAKSQGFTFIVGNPGTATNAKYFNAVDNIVIFQADTGFPSKDSLCSQDTNGKGRGSVSIMPYSIGSLNEAQVRDAKACAGFIYVTDDALPNPWDTLPSYLTQLFGVLRN